jgi:hypothetical protein
MAAQDKNASARESLGFAREVTARFAPMLTTRGFACSETTPYVIRYISADVTLTMSHDRLSYEIEVSFARNADPTRRYSLSDVLQAMPDPEREQEIFFQASTPDRVVTCVKAIAELLEQIGHGALTGDSSTYDRIAETARLRDTVFTKAIVQKPIRAAADSAWHSHDYAKVRDLYQTIEADLTPVENERLKYARSHSTGGAT